MTKITKVNFLIHPVCWAHSLVNGKAPLHSRDIEYMAVYELEKKVRKRQDEFISRMKENELLILYPIGQKEEMLKLEEHASEVLGERCIILRRNPMNSSTITGYLPDDLLLELSKEMLDFCIKFGYDWNAQSIKVLYTSRAWAYDIQNEMDRRNLEVDPKSVVSEAFGEGFEQCAMTWKGMISSYLGWVNPIENNYELSVSGAPFLVYAKFKERVVIQDDIRLFLWEGPDDRPIGLFARASFKMTDPRFYVRIDKDLDCIDVRVLHGDIVWPFKNNQHNPLREGAESLIVPVYEGSRRFFDDQALYIRGKNITMDMFKAMLLNMRVEQG